MHVQSTLDDELVIHLPANFKTKNLPESMQQETPFGTFSIRAEASGGKISLKTRVSFQKTRVAKSEYPAFRAFCEAADRAFAQRIVVGPAK